MAAPTYQFANNANITKKDRAVRAFKLSLLVLAISGHIASAQGPSGGPGPGPAPNPWVLSGSTISYSKGGVTIPQNVVGGDQGAGTINVSVGYYVGGVPLTSLPCTLCALTTNPLSQFASTTSAQLATTISDETGSGSLVFSTSPTLVTPSLGIATATSINKVAITAPATSATLTIANGKTLSVGNSLTLNGTDGTTMTFPGSSDTVATLTAAQTLTNKTISGASNTMTSIATTALTGTLQATQFPGLIGDVTTTAGSLATTITAGAVTYAKMQNVTASSLLGNFTGSSTSASAITLDPSLTFSGAALAVNLTHANTWSAQQSISISQNTSTSFTVTNLSTGISAEAAFITTNSNDISAFGTAGSAYTAIAALQNKTFIYSGPALSGLAFYNIGATPIDFYVNGSRAGGFATTGLFSVNDGLLANTAANIQASTYSYFDTSTLSQGVLATPSSMVSTTKSEANLVLNAAAGNCGGCTVTQFKANILTAITGNSGSTGGVWSGAMVATAAAGFGANPLRVLELDANNFSQSYSIATYNSTGIGTFNLTLTGVGDSNHFYHTAALSIGSGYANTPFYDAGLLIGIPGISGMNTTSILDQGNAPASYTTNGQYATAIMNLFNTHDTIGDQGIVMGVGSTICNDTSTKYLAMYTPTGTALAGSVTRNDSGGTCHVMYGGTSDQRLKHDLGPLDGAINRVMGIRVHKYVGEQYDGPVDGKYAVGFFAQELNQQYPWAVIPSSDPDYHKHPWQVDYGMVTPLLTAAIQDQQHGITQISGRIDQINDRMTSLEVKVGALLARDSTDTR
ncbi:tail fiber domain-containing protein [Bradyrhizobium genosp. P]|uniref:tail fiber domain-containing protein n=1 Tax=Bradyrhizobium genosp. P TaxID=83641 RepID=UPI003CF8180C